MTPSAPNNEQNIPMPCKEDKLFVDSLPDWENNACISMRYGGSYPYINGYLYAARLLVNEVTSTQSHQDTLVYPAVFLYRHHIELQLKDNLRHALYLADTNIPADLRKHPLGSHGLTPLWEHTVPLLAEICRQAGWEMYDQDTLAGVYSYLDQLSTLDESSFSFRYPTTKKGEPSLPLDLHRINIRHFAETIERLVAFLDEISCGFSELQEMKSEMEASYS